MDSVLLWNPGWWKRVEEEHGKIPCACISLLLFILFVGHLLSSGYCSGYSREQGEQILAPGGTCTVCTVGCVCGCVCVSMHVLGVGQNKHTQIHRRIPARSVLGEKERCRRQHLRLQRPGPLARASTSLSEEVAFQDSGAKHPIWATTMFRSPDSGRTQFL